MLIQSARFHGAESGLNAILGTQDAFFTSRTRNSRKGAVTPLWQGR